ncbi:LysR family transcriptional regulator [Maridesulfovibrio bastinii]|uniref:LysR family transcriptional regulator n=1 Tax=Maridesulfovibrio bastinii TaxID=47157 RepID=UPI00146F9746|nr:LysR family transcriptional regulator [Maridesulfovibrio bastinii]
MKTNLAQWQLLQAVVELGSYQKAAQKYHRTQSSVSYQLSMLQEGLDLQLLDIVGRKAQLTEAGRDLLAQAKILLDGMYALEAKAEAFRCGERARIDLVVDSIFPKAVLFKLLEDFHLEHPQTQIHLTETLRSESLNQLSEHTGDLYLIHLPESSQHLGKLILEIPFIAVACEGYGLLDLPQPLHERDLARFPLIRIVDRKTQKSPETETAENWSFTSVESAIEAVLHGFGYAWLPEPYILNYLQAGAMLKLPLQNGCRRMTSIYLVQDAALEHDAVMGDLINLLDNLSV